MSAENIGHAARDAEGRTKFVNAWKSAWDAADLAAANAPVIPPSSRKEWASKIMEIRNRPVPPCSDAETSPQFVLAWEAAWKAAWEAAFTAAKVSLVDRQETNDRKRWDKKGRATRASAGQAAGCDAWNATYRAEIKKLP